MQGESGFTAEASPLIGILLDHIESDYHVELIESAVRVATRRGARTLILPGGALSSQGSPGSARGFLYNYLEPASLDGLLILGGSLSNYCGAEGFENFLERLPSVPRVVVGLKCARAVSVGVNNEDGISRLVDHLVDIHRCDKIAFIDGPDGSSEARLRRKAYSESIRRHNLRLDERFIVPGGLGREQGIDAVVHLLDVHRMSPDELDAIVAVNDAVALGVLEELARRNIHVPNEIAVVGFDDAPNAHAASPPLTTVSQRVYEQGATAMSALLETLGAGKRLTSMELLPDLVLRESCGCHSVRTNDAHLARLQSAIQPLSLADEKDEIARAIKDTAHGRLLGGPGWPQALVHALLTELAGRRTFLGALTKLARRAGPTGIEVCHDILTTLRLEVLRRVSFRSDEGATLEDLFQEARLALADVSLFTEKEHHAAQALYLRVITRACLNRAHGGEIGELAVALEEQLPLFGIRRFVVARGGADELEVIAQSDKRAAPQSTVSTSELGRDLSLKDEEHVIVLPLSAADRQVGLAAFNYGSADPFLFEQLRDLLGMALGIELA